MELFLVDPAVGTTRFWDTVEVAWPSLDPIVIDDLPVVSATVLRLYQERYSEIHAARR